MPHLLNIDGISESLFLLQNLVHGSQSFCAKHQISRENEETKSEFDWEYYFQWLKSISCEHLIKISIKMRMLEDILESNVEDIDIKMLDTDSRKGLNLGYFHEGTEILTLRESWNKVIHAIDIRFQWDDKKDYEVWNGKILLSGKKGNKEWKLELDVEPFITATFRYLQQLETSIDWYHLYKYDS